MSRIYILICALAAAQPLLADDIPTASLFVEFLEYRFDNDVVLLDAEAEYGNSANRAILKVVGLADQSETQTAVALLYRRALWEKFDLQAGIEVTGDARNFILGFQAEAAHHVATEMVTFFDENSRGFVAAKVEHEWSLSERLALWPRLEVFGAFQSNEEDNAAAGLRLALTDVRLRFEVNSHFIPYVGLSWEQALGDTRKLREATGEETSVLTAVAGASFSF